MSAHRLMVDLVAQRLLAARQPAAKTSESRPAAHDLFKKSSSG